MTVSGEQTDAILELKLYRLARLEILVIQQELAEKRKRAKEIGRLLAPLGIERIDLDGWGYPIGVTTRGEEIPDSLVRAAKLAVATCPAAALRLERRTRP